MKRIVNKIKSSGKVQYELESVLDAVKQGQQEPCQKGRQTVGGRRTNEREKFRSTLQTLGSEENQQGSGVKQSSFSSMGEA